MLKNLFRSVPPEYAVCVKSQCPLAGECLHHIAYEQLSQLNHPMRLLAPAKCSADDSCSHFRSNELVAYARGFTNVQRRMYPDQYDRFMQMMLSRYSRTAYFSRRCGDIALTPGEQRLVRRLLQRVGVTEYEVFDDYEYAFSWYD